MCSVIGDILMKVIKEYLKTCIIEAERSGVGYVPCGEGDNGLSLHMLVNLT